MSAKKRDIPASAYVSVNRVGKVRHVPKRIRALAKSRLGPSFRWNLFSMDATIHDLGQLLLKAIPTVIFFLFLTAYLDRVFFKPMAQILEERRKATDGMRELSEKAFAAADEKASAYERALQSARAEISAANEKIRQQWLKEQAEIVAKARAESETKLAAERNVINNEVAQAGQDMQAQIQPLTDRIISSLLRRRAA